MKRSVCGRVVATRQRPDYLSVALDCRAQLRLAHGGAAPSLRRAVRKGAVVSASGVVSAADDSGAIDVAGGLAVLRLDVPDAAAVLRVLVAVEQGGMDGAAARAALRCSAAELAALEDLRRDEGAAKELKAESLRIARRRYVRRVVVGAAAPASPRIPSHGIAETRKPRNRVLKLRKTDEAALAALEAALHPPLAVAPLADDGSVGAPPPGTCGEDDAALGVDLEAMTALHSLPARAMAQVGRGHRTRAEYAHSKKTPQLRCLVSLLRPVLARLADAAAAAAAAPPVVVDIGGGRGDLAMWLARTEPRVRVLVVDSNAPSLHAGEARAGALGLEMRFFAGTAAEAAAAGAFAGAALFVGLHACGRLTDEILRVAAGEGAPCCVVPCCYTKGAADVLVAGGFAGVSAAAADVVCRLAEGTERREVMRRAMRAVAQVRAQRAARAYGGREVAVRVMAWEEEISPRNLVILVDC